MIDKTDFFLFVKALEIYLKSSRNEQDSLLFQSSIKELTCEDFRLYYCRARYLNNINDLDSARCEIDRSIELVASMNRGLDFENRENSSMLLSSPSESMMSAPLPLPPIKKQIADVYFCAGEIYAKLNEGQKSLEYYKLYQYYASFLKTEFDVSESLRLFSFRRFNEHTLSDLINNTLTVCSPKCMNDPFDSIFNLWASKENLLNICSDDKHVAPYSASFDYFRLRSFCKGKGNIPVRNVLMWSHYGGDHSGFCVKYRFSKHFIVQEEGEDYSHMYMKSVSYKNDRFRLSEPSINSNLAFATKKTDWRYEHEVRLIVYNPNIDSYYYSIPLDPKSSVESIFFGYRCSEVTINTILNVYRNRESNKPTFYRMVMDENDVYRLKYERIDV